MFALAAPTVFWAGGGPDDLPRIYFANHTSHLDFESKPALLERARLAICALRALRSHRRGTDVDGTRMRRMFGIDWLAGFFRHRRAAWRRR